MKMNLEKFRKVRDKQYLWSIGYDGEIVGLTAGGHGFEVTGVNLTDLVAEAIGHAAANVYNRPKSKKARNLESELDDALAELIEKAYTVLRKSKYDHETIEIVYEVPSSERSGAEPAQGSTGLVETSDANSPKAV